MFASGIAAREPARNGATDGTRARLVGRRDECGVLDRLLSELRAGHGSALILRGEPGVGKSALLGYCRDRASGCRVALTAGAGSEADLTYAGVHRLCATMLNRIERLPAPQQVALGTAFGLQDGAAPDPFLVGLAVLTLMSVVAQERPLVCVVDDVQWLDPASTQALAFVARRLVAEPIALLFAARPVAGRHSLTGVPELTIRGLPDGDARALLRSVIAGPLEPRVCNRIVAETGGIPLALLELPRGLASAELGGGFGVPDALARSGAVDEGVRERIARLPRPTRSLLLLAAADPTGDALLMWRAADRLGIDLRAAGPAVVAGLIDLGSHVHFRGSAVRSAVYRAASLEDRQRVHLALAESTDSEFETHRRVWHRAQAAPALDETVAAELERFADAVQEAGGVAAAAAFLARAAELTPDPRRRAERALTAAEVKLRVGAHGAALLLLTPAEAAAPDDLRRARIDALRARIEHASGHADAATGSLLAAARRLEPLDDALARATYVDAFSMAAFAERAARVGLPQVASEARRAPRAQRAPRDIDLLLDGLAVRFTEGVAAAAPICRRALEALRRREWSSRDPARGLWLASLLAAELWDDEAWFDLSTRHLALARDAGELGELPSALTSRILLHLFAGELDAAATLVEVTHGLGPAPPATAAPLGLAALEGRTSLMGGLLDARDGGVEATIVHWATALLCNGSGGFHHAVTAARRAAEPDSVLANWGLTELIESAARSGRRELAAEAFERLAPRTRASGTAWALGVEARSRALLCDEDAAETLYRESIERLGRTRVRVELARAHLVYGEWLRRAGRRRDARARLQTAHELFDAMGAEVFAARARRELAATGEHVRARGPEGRDELTAQERQIARMAREGHTNAEIGAHLFISPRTVEWHLRHVFAKLGIRSRRELAVALAPGS
jgi:DNA-binding CsgD family transcriptional regulator